MKNKTLKISAIITIALCIILKYYFINDRNAANAEQLKASKNNNVLLESKIDTVGIRKDIKWDSLAKDIIRLNKIPQTFMGSKKRILDLVRNGSLTKEEAIEGIRKATMSIKNHPPELLSALADEFEKEVNNLKIK